MSQSGPKCGLGLVATCICLAFVVHLGVSVEPSPEFLVGLASLLFLEVRAPRHHLFGFASVTFPLYIFLALLPGSSLGAVAILAVIFIALREFTVKRDATGWVVWEFVTDALPICFALGLLQVSSKVGPQWAGLSVLSLLLIAVAHFLLRPVLQGAWLDELPESLQKGWQSDLVSATTLCTLVSFLAIPFGLLAGSEPRAGFFLPIILFLLNTAIVPLLDPTKNHAKLRLAEQDHLRSQTLGTPLPEKPKASAQTNQTAIDLRKEDYSFLKQMSDSLSDNPTVARVWDEIVWVARRLVNVDSAVAFRLENGEFKAWGESKTNKKDELSQAEAEGRTEPVVLRAQQSGRVEFVKAQDAEAGRIFATETIALAVPIPGRGVLYLGKDEGALFSDDEVARLNVLGQHSRLAVLAAEYHEAVTQAQHTVIDANQRADVFQVGYSALKGMTSELMSADTQEEILRRAGSRLGQLVINDYWVITAGRPGSWPPELYVAGPPSMPKIDKNALMQLAEVAVQRGVCVLENQLKDSRLPQPSNGSRSMLAAPLVSAEGPLGAVLLFSASSGAFLEAQRELLGLFGFMLGFRLSGAYSQATPDDLAEELKNCQKRLVQSSKMAAIGQSAAGVAHEINTPLGAIMLAIEGAVKSLRTEPERTEKRLRRALASSAQLKEIVGKLLAFSREGTARETQTDLNTVVQDAVSLLGNQLALDNIHLECNLQEVDLVLANHTEIQQIAINLITNARDAILERQDEGPRNITINTSNHAKAVELSVSDTGVGMDESVQARVFEPFFTTKEKGKGTGLGLSVTRELVEKHGGAIRVQSQPGEGTRFVLRLPKQAS